jgi:hypothetical protein
VWLHAIFVSQDRGKIFYCGFTEGRPIAQTSCHASDFAQERFHELRDGHARWDGVGVDDDVRDDS